MIPLKKDFPPLLVNKQHALVSEDISCCLLTDYYGTHILDCCTANKCVSDDDTFCYYLRRTDQITDAQKIT